MLNLLLSAVLWGHLVCPAQSAAIPSEILPQTGTQELYLSAGHFFQTQDYAHAAAQYQEFLKQDSDQPGDLEARMMLAESLDREGISQLSLSPKRAAKILKQAKKAYKKVARDAPSGDDLAESARFRLGEMAFNLGQYDEAVSDMESLVSNYPSGTLRGEARLIEAEALMSQKRFPKAETLLEEALKEQPAYAHNPRLKLARGIALFETGSPAAALASLSGLKSPLALLYSARANMDLGKPLIAVENLKSLIANYPDDPAVETSRYLVGEAFFEAEDYTSALQIFNQFLMDFPRSSLRGAATYKMGLCNYELKDYMAARGDFESVEQMSPPGEFAEPSLYMMGESFLKEGNYTKAGFDYSDLSSAYSDALAGTAKFKLAWTQYKRQEYPEAGVTLNSFIVQYSSHPLVPAAAYLNGNTLESLGKYRKAAHAYQQTLDLAAPNATPYRNLIWNPALAMLSRSYLEAGEYGHLISGYQYILKENAPTQDPWRAAALLYIAEGYYRQGLYDQALPIYREIIHSYPATPESIVAKDGISWCLFKQGHFSKSYQERVKLEALKNAPAIAPSKTVFVDENPGADLFLNNQYAQAVTLFNQKKYAEALDAFQLFEKDYAEDPRAADAALEEGWCYYRLNYYGDAVKTWERVQASYSSTEAAKSAAWATADTYFRAAQYDAAVAAYQHILQAYPDDLASSYARLRIAQSYYNAKNIPQAISAFEDVLNNSPGDKEGQEVLSYLTQMLYQPQSKDAALKALESLAASQSSNPIGAKAELGLGLYFFETGDYTSAVQNLEEAIPNLSRDKDIRDAQYDLAQSYYALKRYEDAQRAYERFTENYPDDSRFRAALFRMGTSAFNLKDFEKAASAFHQLAAQYPKSHYAALALYNSSLAYRKLGDWESAALALKNYINLYPAQAQKSSAASELASVYEQERDYAKAIKDLEAMRISLKNDDPAFLAASLEIAKDYAAMGDQANSLKEYQAIVASPLKDNSYRLNALADLGRYYEDQKNWALAAKTYDELALSASDPSWRDPARARAQADREKISKTASANSPQNQVQNSSAPAGGGTQ